MILLGIHENLKEPDPEKHFTITGVYDSNKIITDFWNTINGNKVNVNLLVDEDVYPLDFEGTTIVVIEVPRASYTLRPVYTGENPFKGSFKRNHEGDYHCSEAEIRAMYRDQNPDGNDSLIMEYYTMDDIDADTLKRYRRLFRTIQPEHIWNDLNDQEFLEQLGGYRRDRRIDGGLYGPPRRGQRRLQRSHCRFETGFQAAHRCFDAGFQTRPNQFRVCFYRRDRRADVGLDTVPRCCQ